VPCGIYYAQGSLNLNPILQPLIWEEPFELIYDVFDYAVEVVLGQCVDKKPHVMCYACHIMRWILLLQAFDYEIRDKKGS